MVNYLIQNWQDGFDKCFLLFQRIKSSGFIPNVVIGVARGGWIPARLLADFFKVKETVNIKVEAYELIGELNVEAKITQDISVSLRDKSVLIVDDIADSGSSLEVVLGSLKKRDPKEVKIATLYYKPKSSIIPDYYITQTNDWVIFPWEIYESINEIYDMGISDGKNHDKLVEEIKSIGFPPFLVDSYFS